MSNGDQPTAANDHDQDEDEARVRQVVADWVDGSRLEVQEEKHGLVVCNPHSRDRGRVHFDFDGKHVSWQLTRRMTPSTQPQSPTTSTSPRTTFTSPSSSGYRGWR